MPLVAHSCGTSKKDGFPGHARNGNGRALRRTKAYGPLNHAEGCPQGRSMGFWERSLLRRRLGSARQAQAFPLFIREFLLPPFAVLSLGNVTWFRVGLGREVAPQGLRPPERFWATRADGQQFAVSVINADVKRHGFGEVDAYGQCSKTAAPQSPSLSGRGLELTPLTRRISQAVSGANLNW
jgi:hypothetical protein